MRYRDFLVSGARDGVRYHGSMNDRGKRHEPLSNYSEEYLDKQIMNSKRELVPSAYQFINAATCGLAL